MYSRKNRKVRPTQNVQILNTERVIAIPSNNSQIFTFSNNLIRLQIPNVAGKAFSPFKQSGLSMNISYSNAGSAVVNPYLSFNALIFQVQMSSTLKGVPFHTLRYYARCLNSTELENYGYREISKSHLGNLSKSMWDYETHDNATTAASGVVGASGVNVYIPLYTQFLETPDLASIDLAQLGGISIEIMLMSNSGYFIDAASQAQYSMTNVKFHYDLLTIAPNRAGQEIFFRCTESRPDNILSNSEYKSVSVNNSNVESLIVDAVPSASQNSYIGDSFANNKLVALAQTTAFPVMPDTDNATTLGQVGLLEFRESVNGISLPLQQVYQVPNPAPPALNTASDGLSNILRESYKALIKSAFYEHPRTTKNYYTYDNNKEAQGSSVQNNNPFNVSAPVSGSFATGVVPIPRFTFGFLTKAGGAMMPESNISYKIVENINAGYFLVNHLSLIKRLLVGKNGELQVLN